MFEKHYGLDQAVTADLLKTAFESGIGNATAQTLSLSDLRLHGAIEHDVSLVRDDSYFGNNYSINKTLVKDLLESSQDGAVITTTDLGIYRKNRYLDSVARNPELKFDTKEQIAAFTEAATILAIFGNPVSINYIQSFIEFEKLPDDFEPKKFSKWYVLYLAAKIKWASR
jgi:hypothetical protein